MRAIFSSTKVVTTFFVYTYIYKCLQYYGCQISFSFLFVLFIREDDRYYLRTSGFIFLFFLRLRPPPSPPTLPPNFRQEQEPPPAASHRQQLKFFPLQDGGVRGLPYQVLQPQSQEADGVSEHDGVCWLPVPAPDAAGEAKETQRFLLFRGQRREGEVSVSGEVPRKSKSTSSTLSVQKITTGCKLAVTRHRETYFCVSSK